MWNRLLKTLWAANLSAVIYQQMSLKKCEFTFPVLVDCINKLFETVTSLFYSEEANVTPVFKENENYRSESILPFLCKVFEKLSYRQLINYMKRYFSSILCGFWKVHNTQHALFRLFHSWQKEVRPKTYDCIPHDLLTPSRLIKQPQMAILGYV